MHLLKFKMNNDDKSTVPVMQAATATGSVFCCIYFYFFPLHLEWKRERMSLNVVLVIFEMNS